MKNTGIPYIPAPTVISIYFLKRKSFKITVLYIPYYKATKITLKLYQKCKTEPKSQSIRQSTRLNMLLSPMLPDKAIRDLSNTVPKLNIQPPTT